MKVVESKTDTKKQIRNEIWNLSNCFKSCLQRTSSPKINLEKQYTLFTLPGLVNETVSQGDQSDVAENRAENKAPEPGPSGITDQLCIDDK